MLDTLLSIGFEPIVLTLNHLVVLAATCAIMFFLYKRTFSMRISKTIFLGSMALGPLLLQPDFFTSPLMPWIFGLFGLLAVMGLLQLAQKVFTGEQSVPTLSAAGQGSEGAQKWLIASLVVFVLFVAIGDALRGPDDSWVLKRAGEILEAVSRIRQGLPGP